MKMRKLIILLVVFILEACAVHKQEPLNAYDMEDYTLTCQYGFNFNPDLFNSDGRLFLASGDVNEYAPDISALMLISGQDDKTLNTMQDLLNKLPPNKREELLKKMVFYRDIFWIQSLEEENMSMEGYSMEEFQSVLNKDEYFISETESAPIDDLGKFFGIMKNQVKFSSFAEVVRNRQMQVSRKRMQSVYQK